jgi:hypothetical protein
MENLTVKLVLPIARFFPLAQAFRLGPQDGIESSLTEGKVDDFRIYHVELNTSEISGIYGGGNGDFYNRSIEFSYDSNLQIPKPVTIRFLEDGLPVELNATGSGQFSSADLSVTNATLSNPTPGQAVGGCLCNPTHSFG